MLKIWRRKQGDFECSRLKFIILLRTEPNILKKNIQRVYKNELKHPVYKNQNQTCNFN